MMREIYIKNYEKEGYEVVTIDYIKDNIDNLLINDIFLGDGTVIRTDDIIARFLDTDKEHPIVIYKNGKNVQLFIDPNWYVENTKDVDELINYICKSVRNEKISIDNDCFINDELVDSLCKNDSLKEVSLAQYQNDGGYSLSKNHYDRLKKSSIEKVNSKGVDKELEDNFDPLIGFNSDRHLVGYKRYKDLQSGKSIHINDVLKDDEIYNLKYINSECDLIFNEDSYIDVDNVINRLKKLGLNNRIVIDIKDKNKFNNYLLNNSFGDGNIYIKNSGMEVSLKDYLRFEKQLYELVEPAKDLSPFEKYIYAYNQTKKFKEYRENEEDKMSARELYQILENKFMVCVGFSEMFGDLLSKLNIDSKDLSISVDTSYDKAFKNEEDVEGVSKGTVKAGHARRYVYIKDEKYGIDGFYVADPTWDNDLEKDLYCHLALTDKEASNAKRYLWINKYSSLELFNVTSIEEFYKKINFLLNKNSDKTLDYFIKDLISDLSLLDKEYVNKLKEKYSFIDEYVWPEDITDMIYDLGDYIVSHANKEISGETIMEAVSNVYKNAYGYSDYQLDETMPKIIEENREMESKYFPIRYMIDSEGNQKVIMNENNKFDIIYNGKNK